MPLQPEPLTRVKTRVPRRRKVAAAIVRAHPANTTSIEASSISSVRVVCISDTHNSQPVIPSGDIVIHAGDLTENGSFDEVQTSLNWLSSLPHKHKILVAGNHDVLLDDAFLSKHPERRYGQSKSRHDLDWGDVTYLRDSAITLEISDNTLEWHANTSNRTITIFGSPWTPQYGSSAFQYRPSNYDHWEEIFSALNHVPDIIVTHGPPHLHLDKRDFHRAGCPYLAQEIRRLRPRLHVFGHIHVGYGKETVALDTVQSLYEEVATGWSGWGAVVIMFIAAVWTRLLKMFHIYTPGKQTTFVNASIVGDKGNFNDPIVVDI